jgi:hypothetical protein
MEATGGLLARLRQPEYTGENRCLPCTAVNTLIAAVLSAGAGAGIALFASVAVGATTGVVVFLCCLSAIYLRGYLVPGTPTLTKRYFPEWALSAFGKAPDRPDRSIDEEAIDPERELLDVGALEPCPEGEDLCLTEGFRDRWDDEVDRVKGEEDAGRDDLLELLGVDSADVRFTEHGAAFQAFVDDTVVGRWESQAAFLADVGAARVLAREHPHWEAFPVEARGQLLNGLRLFIDTCPSCGGTPTFGTETVESCCSTQDVAAVTCGQCDARLFESVV